MTELLHNASDDQAALALCFAAVTISGLVMYFSYHLGMLTGGAKVESQTQPRSAMPVSPPSDFRREKAA